MELKIRENQKGNYVIIHANDFEKGIDFASLNDLDQIQLRGGIGKEKQYLDFQLFHKISKKLKTLSFSGFDNKLNQINNFEAIYSLGALENLYIPEKQNFDITISKFKKLKELSIEYSSKIIDLTKSKSLEILVISAGYSEKDLSLLENLSSLKKLHIYKSLKLENLTGIDKLIFLSELKLAFNNSLIDISCIQKSSIEKLIIEKCKKLTDFSVLKDNNTIKELFITELGSLQFVLTMKKLEKIHFWDCIDGDMTPILKSPTLKTAFITKDKKHYTHKQKEITESLEKNRRN